VSIARSCQVAHEPLTNVRPRTPAAVFLEWARWTTFWDWAGWDRSQRNCSGIANQRPSPSQRSKFLQTAQPDALPLTRLSAQTRSRPARISRPTSTPTPHPRRHSIPNRSSPLVLHRKGRAGDGSGGSRLGPYDDPGGSVRTGCCSWNRRSGEKVAGKAGRTQGQAGEEEAYEWVCGGRGVGVVCFRD